MLGVVYLLFNEGYAATGGADLLRPDLSSEAIRLARTLAALMPDEPEVLGLLALLLLHDARRATRLDAEGDLITLEDQDRTRCDREQIGEGTSMLGSARRRRHLGRYQIQAAIAACHASAPTPDATDWPRIAALYGELLRFVPSDVVRLNRAVAVAMAASPAAGLAIVDDLAESGALNGYYLLPATQADLLRRLGRRAEATERYRAALALALVPTDVEHRFLLRRLAEATSQELT